MPRIYNRLTIAVNNKKLEERIVQGEKEQFSFYYLKVKNPIHHYDIKMSMPSVLILDSFDDYDSTYDYPLVLLSDSAPLKKIHRLQSRCVVLPQDASIPQIMLAVNTLLEEQRKEYFAKVREILDFATLYNKFMDERNIVDEDFEMSFKQRVKQHVNEVGTGSCLNIEFEKNGKRGILNNIGNIQVPALYDELDFTSFGIVRIGDKYGIHSANNYEKPVPVEYDRIDPCQAGLYKLYKDGKVTPYFLEMNLSGTYDDIIPTENGLAYYLYKDDKWGIYSSVCTIEPKFDHMEIPQNDLGWVCVKQGEEWGYIDINGEFTKDMKQAAVYIYAPTNAIQDILDFEDFEEV